MNKAQFYYDKNSRTKAMVFYYGSKSVLYQCFLTDPSYREVTSLLRLGLGNTELLTDTREGFDKRYTYSHTLTLEKEE